MAKTTPTNPYRYDGPDLELVSMLAEDAKKWVAGTPCIFASGTVSPAVSATTTGIFGFFADAQSTNTSTSTVKVWKILSASTRFVGYVSNDDADTTAATANKGVKYGLHIGTSGATIYIASVNTNDEAGPVVYVDQLYHEVETGKAASTDDPGRVIFRFTAASLDAS